MTSKIEKGKFYYLKIKHFGRELEYEGKILWVHKDSFRIQTEDDTRLRFDLKQIFYAKEIEKQKEKIVKINSKKKFIPWSKLKKVEGPDLG